MAAEAVWTETPTKKTRVQNRGKKMRSSSGGKRAELTVAALRERLAYDPDSGVFRWLAKPGNGRITNSWNARYSGKPAGSVDPTKGGYLIIKLNGLEYNASRLAYLYMRGCWPLSLMDHKNGNRSDNRWENLRPADYAQNATNRRGTASSGLKGAYRCPSKIPRWFAAIRINGRNIRLGTFATAEEAHEAYVAASVREHGEYGRAR